MKLLTGALILAAAFVTCGAGPSLAGSFFVQAHGGWSFYNLDDVNDAIDAANEEAGASLGDHISSGLDVGLHAGLSMTSELNLGLGYARLSGSSGFSSDGYLVEYDLPADLYEVFLDYLPAGDQKVRTGAGATMGMIRSAATLRVTDPMDGHFEDKFEGMGFLFAGYVIADAAVTSSWSLFGQAGFRHAIINDLEVDGEMVLNPDSLDDKLRFNYSGLFVRLGVQFRP
jgi:hypothetical protein